MYDGRAGALLGYTLLSSLNDWSLKEEDASLKSGLETFFKQCQTGIQGLNCITVSMVGTPHAPVQQSCEMSGPLSHAAPDSIVHCLCPELEPQTFKSKV